MDTSKIPCTPENLRHLLMQAAMAVATGRLGAKDAHAIAVLSQEVHKSLKMEYVGTLLEQKDVIRMDQAIQVIGHVS